MAFAMNSFDMSSVSLFSSDCQQIQQHEAVPNEMHLRVSN